VKRIYSSHDGAELGLLASQLDSLGIPCEVRSESPVFPSVAFGPELWILRDEDYEQASRFVSSWMNPNSSSQAGGTTANEVPAEEMGDHRSLDAIIAALYRIISGPPELERDWPRFRELFHPDAKLIRAMTNQDGEVSLSVMTVQEFIDFASPYFRSKPFFELEIFRKVDQFGQIAHVFSTFDSSSTPAGTDSLGRGINSIQLWTDGNRWWVLQMVWDNERPGNIISPVYLPP
jgi:hypothetical protein